MSASKNPDSVSGEFHSRVAPSVPLEQGGHKPGIISSDRDTVPTFSAQTLSPGTAPASSTFEANPDLNNQRMYQSASSTLTGADSASLHTGLGHPGQGMTSQEAHHDGGNTRGDGLVGRTSVGNKEKVVNAQDPAFKNQRALDRDVPSGERGSVGGPAAEERVPAGAEEVASEAPRGR